MKSRRILFLFVVAAILIAFFTNPSESNFETFIQPQVGKVSSPPLIEYKDHQIYSEAVITYYTPSTVNGMVTAAAGKEKYIGFLGRFWKMK